MREGYCKRLNCQGCAALKVNHDKAHTNITKSYASPAAAAPTISFYFCHHAVGCDPRNAVRSSTKVCEKRIHKKMASPLGNRAFVLHQLPAQNRIHLYSILHLNTFSSSYETFIEEHDFGELSQIRRNGIAALADGRALPHHVRI